jgi:hypothetical protein
MVWGEVGDFMGRLFGIGGGLLVHISVIWWIRVLHYSVEVYET